MRLIALEGKGAMDNPISKLLRIFRERETRGHKVNQGSVQRQDARIELERKREEFRRKLETVSRRVGENVRARNDANP